MTTLQIKARFKEFGEWQNYGNLSSPWPCNFARKVIGNHRGWITTYVFVSFQGK